MQPGVVVEGRYRIVEKIDEGGMGEVYFAEHVLLERKVAIKFLRTELARDSKLLGRFMNEARAAGSLGHPNIVEALDMGFLPDGVPYIVFEYLEGRLLAEEIRKSGALTMVRALSIGQQIASAMTAVHEAGIIHRDLKTENVFLAKRGEATDHVKVLDFGVSRFVDSELSVPTGIIWGTPSCLAPEQITAPHTVDGRADIYALGVVMFEMIIGERPFRSTGDQHEVLRRVLNEPPPVPQVADAPAGLGEAIAHRMLAKDMTKRFASMREVRDMLEEKLAEVGYWHA